MRHKFKGIRVLLADNRGMVCEGLRALLEKEPGITVVRKASGTMKAVDLVKKLKPSVVVIDLPAPTMIGIEAIRQMVAGFPEIKVVAISDYPTRRYILKVLRAGCTAFVAKSSAVRELVKAVRSVALSHVYLCPIARKMVARDDLKQALASEYSSPNHLTSREREVLQLLTEGNSTRKIAEQLSISVKTVETHRQNIMNKLELRSTAELVKYAIREGITSVTSLLM